MSLQMHAEGGLEDQEEGAGAQTGALPRFPTLKIVWADTEPSSSDEEAGTSSDPEDGGDKARDPEAGGDKAREACQGCASMLVWGLHGTGGDAVEAAHAAYSPPSDSAKGWGAPRRVAVGAACWPRTEARQVHVAVGARHAFAYR